MANIIATKSRRFSRKKVLFIVGTILVVSAGGFAFSRTSPGSTLVDSIVGVFTGGNSADTAKDEDSNKSESSAVNVNKLYTDATNDIKAGDPQEAVQTYEEAVRAKDESSEKALLYRELSASLLNYGTTDEDKQQSLQYALKAEGLDPGQASAAQLSLVYRALNNIAEAQKYEALVIERDTSVWKDR